MTQTTQIHERINFTRFLFACCVGSCLTGILWLIARNPWAGVFTVGFCIGIIVMDNCGLNKEIRDISAYTMDLEKQIVALRSTIHNISIYQSNDTSDIHTTIKKKIEGLRNKNTHISRSLSFS